MASHITVNLKVHKVRSEHEANENIDCVVSLDSKQLNYTRNIVIRPSYDCIYVDNVNIVLFKQ